MQHKRIINTTIQRVAAIASLIIAAKLAVTNDALASAPKVQPPSPPSPQNTMLCPFSGTEATFQLIALDGSDTHVETSHDDSLLEATANLLAQRLQNLDLEIALEETSITLRQPEQIILQFPGTLPLNALDKALQALAQNGQLTFRPQRENTSTEQLTVLIRAREELEDDSSDTQAEADLAQINEAIALLFHPAAISGDRIQTAEAVPSLNGQWQIDIEFDQPGSHQFALLTQKLAGSEQALGIFWNDTLMAAPIVPPNYATTGITGGEASISGHFTEAEARAIALQLRQPPLPTNIELAQIQLMKRNEPCFSEP